MVEVLVVIAILSVLMSILLAVMPKAREGARRTKCGANLQQLQRSILLYAQDQPGMNTYPCTLYVIGDPPTAGTGINSPDPFVAPPVGPAANDVSAALYLLRRSYDVPAAIFICPSADSAVHFADPNPPLQQSNFTDYQKNLCYSFANPYPDQTALNANPPYKLDRSQSASFPLIADKNPGNAGGNSRNHGSEGQNVVYNDGHVEWHSTTKAGTNGDDIYHNAGGQVIASPVNGTDSIMLPADP
jgi:type II secretory pathway pseudopilin PulG